jgi:acyl-CoA thioesterase-2
MASTAANGTWPGPAPCTATFRRAASPRTIQRAASPCHAGAVADALSELLWLLDLESIDVDIFRGRSPAEHRLRVFGGQVAGQALIAAGRTVPVGVVHSLHAYFLRPGDPDAPIVYEVDRIRDGRSFTTRRVIAIQRGKAIFNLSASFHRPERGPEHQLPMPSAPPPESLPTFAERFAPWASQMGDWYHRPRPIDQRYVDPEVTTRRSSSEYRHRAEAGGQQVWIRAAGPLPSDDPLLHACVVAYASDMTLVDTVILPHGITWNDPRLMALSLDHAMWFHAPFRADDWLLYDQRTPVAAGGRGLATGHLFSRDGRLVVTVVQEALVRYLYDGPVPGTGPS